MQLWVLLTLLGLMGPSAGLLPQKLDFSHSKTELNHLLVGETSGVVCLGLIDNINQLLLLDLSEK